MGGTRAALPGSGVAILERRTSAETWALEEGRDSLGVDGWVLVRTKPCLWKLSREKDNLDFDWKEEEN